MYKQTKQTKQKKLLFLFFFHVPFLSFGSHSRACQYFQCITCVSPREWILNANGHFILLFDPNFVCALNNLKLSSDGTETLGILVFLHSCGLSLRNNIAAPYLLTIKNEIYQNMFSFAADSKLGFIIVFYVLCYLFLPG